MTEELEKKSAKDDVKDSSTDGESLSFLDLFQRKWYLLFGVYSCISIIRKSKGGGMKDKVQQIALVIGMILFSVKLESFIEGKVIQPLFKLVFGDSHTRKLKELEMQEQEIKRKLEELKQEAQEVE